MNVSVLSPLPAHDHPYFPVSPLILASLRESIGTDLLPADSAGLFGVWSGSIVADLSGLGEIQPVGLAKRKRADDEDVGDEDDELEDEDDEVDDDDDDDFADDEDDVEEGFDDEDLDDDDEIFYDEDEEE